jgi:FAD/FMN-containing dehydrogenase
LERKKIMVVATRTSIPARIEAPIRNLFDDLRARVTGTVFTSDSEGYDEARSTLYSRERRPSAVIRAANAQDVAEAVRFARDRAFPISVKSGGHSLAQLSVIDGVMMIDLSSMKQVTIDPEQRIGRVQAGATSGDLAGPANAHGLALSTGDTASVGMGGLTTGGGIGFMARKYGLAIDNLLSAEVVTANGEIVTASETEHPDLFWAIRGGGGNFGIVTEFTYRLAPVGQILGGLIALPASREVLRGYLEYAPNAPEDLTTIANVMRIPPLPGIPEHLVGQFVLAIIAVWTGEIGEGEKALEPLRALATPVMDTMAPIQYPEIYRLTDHQSMPHSAAIRSMFTNELNDETLDAVLNAIETASSPMSIVQFRGMGGFVSSIAPSATAFAHRDQDYFVAIIGLWMNGDPNVAVHTEWSLKLWEQIRDEGDGVYVNFLEDEGADRVRDAYPPATYERLAEIKRQYDPENIFRFNQNIAPKR